MKWSALLVAEMPPGAVTTRSTVPETWAGVTAVICVSELTVITPLAGTPPKVTAVAPVKPVPVTVTLVPPAIGPTVGDIAVTVGALT